MKKVVQKQLGELLIGGKLITRENLETALKLQKERGGLIGEILVSMGFTTEETIAQALTAQYGFPYLPLAGYSIDIAVAAIIPETISAKHNLVAVDKVGGVLTLAMSNPLNQAAIDEVEALTHFKVQVFVATATDIREAIKRCFQKS
ncbi:MAG: hypothetical protein WCG06_01630 [Candidatus Omnitrophota bacterium]